MRSFAKIKPSRMAKTLCPESCQSREFLTWQIYLLTLFAKIKFSRISKFTISRIKQKPTSPIISYGEHVCCNWPQISLNFQNMVQMYYLKVVTCTLTLYLMRYFKTGTKVLPVVHQTYRRL